MDIGAWLRDLGLERYEEAFQENEIDAKILPRLTADDLKDIGVTIVGHRRKLLEAIAALAEPAVAAQAQPSTPAETARRERRAEAERRQLTVMFVDLVGSTKLAARFDPEDMGRVMRAYQGCCAAVVERWGGHVAKYMGDGVLAYFGWPQAHEDDAERAVRAGLELAQRVGQLETPADEGLAARVGIATGLVMVGELIGEGAAREETVVGETPNLAARLQALAKPGSVVVSPATRRLLGGLFELGDLGPQRLKGFAEPFAAWRVEGEAQSEGRFEARQTAGLTPLVGRDEEIALLLRRWQQAKDGEGHVVLLSGEPGIGKSRLVREVRARLKDEPHMRLLYQCSPHHTTSPLQPSIEQLERAGAFARDDPPAARLDKLEALLARGTNRLEQAVPLIAALLGVPTEGRYPALDLTPQRQKQLTLAALVEQLEGLAAAQPVLLAYEDVHWSDPTTQELLGLTIEHLQRLPVLLLITYRPEFNPPWPAQPHVSALALARLGRREGAAMVEWVVRDKPLPAEVAAQIVAKTDGVPLFVEELTKTVLESGLLRDAGDHYELSGPLPPLAIPSTLHDSLLARLDRLALVKEVAQIGAALGREFSHALLASVADRPEAELQAVLDQLVAAELVYRRGAAPDVTYSFKHALVRDAAYGTLLKSRRQHLHARIAQVMEEQFPEIVETQPELLAQHYTGAGLTEQAIVYWDKAGERATQRSANAEAIERLSKALELLATLPETPERIRRELALQTRLGPAVIAVKGHAAPEVETVYTRARELCAQVADCPQLLFSTLRGLWLSHMLRARHDAAHEFAERMLALAQQEQSRAFHLEACKALGHTRFYLGEFVVAATHFEEAVRLYNPEQHRIHALLYGTDPAVGSMVYAAWTLWCLGHLDQSLAKSHEALAVARQMAHHYTLAVALCHCALLHQFRRDVQLTEELSEELMAFSAEQGLAYWPGVATVMKGWVLAERGQGEAGITEFRLGIATVRAIGTIAELPWYLALLAGAHGIVGKTAEGLDAIAEALGVVASTNERFYEAEIYRVKGELLLKHSRSDTVTEAESCFHQALDIARVQSAKSWELRTAISLARLWQDQGRHAEAHDLLAPVYGWFTEGFDTPDLKDAKALLDELA
jgi:predicted ATPase/class 3 adenylate cyclase